MSYVWNSSSDWAFDFLVLEPSEALRLPEPSAPVRADGLWRTTCFELFLRHPDGSAYFEFNFSPSGQWAAYEFDGYRSGGRNLEIAPPLIMGSDPRQMSLAWEARMLRQGQDPAFARQMSMGFEHGQGPIGGFTLRALCEHEGLPAHGPWHVGLSAVIEEAHGPMSYWALAHPSDKPDFHHPDSFVLELP